MKLRNFHTQPYRIHAPNLDVEIQPAESVEVPDELAALLLRGGARKYLIRDELTVEERLRRLEQKPIT